MSALSIPGVTAFACERPEGLNPELTPSASAPSYLTKRVSKERMRDAVDVLLTMQNPGGGFASYETINGPAILEKINPAEVFGEFLTLWQKSSLSTWLLNALNTFFATGDIMVEYAYPECELPPSLVSPRMTDLLTLFCLLAELPGTTSVVTGLLKFRAIDDYRRADIE